MYTPSQFEVTDVAVLHDLIRTHPLGALVMHDGDALDANHLPFELDAEPAPGKLLAHVARGNPLWKRAGGEREVLVIFQGAHGYVTPAWYPTKRETGKVVPTWNYAAVHAYGRMRAIEDPVWLRAFVDRLTRRHEASRAEPWHVSDAPEDYIEQMLRGIVGLEVTVTRLVGKLKMSQNRTAADQAGVVEGLKARGDTDDVAMAELVRRYGKGQRNV
jgi:transcriptional regulator